METIEIQVRFFAVLRERTGIDVQRVRVPEDSRIDQLWAMLVPDRPMGDGVLVARNMEYVPADSRMADGDEIAFFPPVTGGAG